MTFVERPPLGSILNAVVIPAAGGDTLFSDQQAAFAGAQPDACRSFLSTLTAVHDGNAQFARALQAREDGGQWEGERVRPSSRWSTRSCARIPRPGAKALFVNPGFTSHIVGARPRAESDALLAFLYAHSHAARVHRALPLARR